MDKEFDASIHGIDIHPSVDGDAPDQVQLDNEQQKLIERKRLEALDRIKKRHGG